MADKTEYEAEMSRTDVAEHLRDLAAEFANDESPVAVTVGNKEVELRPSETVSCSTTVTERSHLIGSDNEEVTVTLSWSPTTE